MATAKRVSNLAIVMSADTTGVTEGLNLAQRSVSNFQSQIAGGAVGSLLGGKIGGVGGLLGGMVGGPVGAAAGAAIGTAIDQTFSVITTSLSAGVSAISTIVKHLVTTGAEYEMAIAAFTAQAGSETQGRSMFKGIQQLGVATIFTSQQLAQQARILMGYGIAADKVVPTLTKLALIAQKSGRGETGLAGGVLAFAQANAIGKLQGQERKQFGEASIGASDFAKTMGVTEQQFEDLLHAGQVGFDVVARTINRMGTESEKTSKLFNSTLIGAFNSAKETAENTFGEIGMGMIKAFNLPEGLLKIAAILQDLPQRAAQLTPVFEKINNLMEPIAKGVYAAFSVMLEAGTQFVTGFVPSMKDSKSAATALGEAIAVGMGTAIDYAIDFGIEFTKSMMAASKAIKLVVNDFAPIKETIDLLIFLQKVTPAAVVQRNFGGSGQAPQDQFEEGIANTLQGFRTAKEGGSYADRARKAFKAGLPSIEPLAPKLDQSGAAEGVKAIAPAINELAKSINENGATGKGQGAFGEFQSSFSNLMAAERQGLIQNKAGADAFLFGEFKKLTGSMARMENTLPAAIDRNTVEGQARIEKVIANTQQRGMDDVPGLLRQANEVHRQNLREQQRVVDELRRIAPTVPLQVG